MIDSHEHPLDEITEFGYTAHGLVRFDSFFFHRRFVDGVPWPVPGLAPNSSQWPLQIVRKPGIEPVPLTTEQLADERAAGRVWQNYALLLSDWQLFGQTIGGWIYWAADGTPWVIQPGVMPTPQAGQPYSLTLSAQPFGFMDEAPAEPVELPLTLADIGQAGSALRTVQFETISSDGSRAIMRLGPVGGGLPTGYLEITVSEVDGALSAVLTVLRTQVQVRGEWATTHPGISSAAELLVERATFPQASISGHADLGDGVPIFPIGGGVVTVSLAGLVEVDAARTSGFADYATYKQGTAEVVSGRTDRLISLQFDDADALCEFCYDTEYRYSASFPSPTGSATGQLSAYAVSEVAARVPVIGYPMDVDVPVTAEVSRTISERIDRTVRLTRNGTTVAQAASYKSYSRGHTLPLTPAIGGRPWCYSRVGGSNDIDGFGEVLEGGSFTQPYLISAGPESFATTATANLGGPWPRAWVVAPTSTTGRGLPQYAAEVPVGSNQPDADTLQLSFAPITYSAARQVAGTALAEREVVGGVTEIREICLAYPHAQALARGVVAAGQGAAYHPLTRELVTDSDGGTPFTFI